MTVPVSVEEVERRKASPSRFVGGKVTKVLARLGSPTSDVDGRRLEHEVHAALARLREQSRKDARDASRRR